MLRRTPTHSLREWNTRRQVRVWADVLEQRGERPEQRWLQRARHAEMVQAIRMLQAEHQGWRSPVARDADDDASRSFGSA